MTRKVVVQQNELLDKRLAAGESIFVGSTDVEEGVRPDPVARTRRHDRPAVALRFTTSLDPYRERNWLRPPDLPVTDRVLDCQDRLARAAPSAVLLAEGFTGPRVFTGTRRAGG
ncbi:hypothetical protein PV728_39365 [Streptomyces europaeiscabiei]|uniref:hypothetical protein n=1 Tax=Streptomyces TaxID=1883 RepID=UPI000A3D1FA3|nr:MULTISPECIES: hypothetical protein [Streptomyces]MDX3636187.1 hypothetical protein [Streptomyces europaeiscabiei]MDX3654235.1 hypothetical protein [Streptomyces europaeiscabiei]